MSEALYRSVCLRACCCFFRCASQREAAERFGVSAASVSRLRNLQLRQCDVPPGPLGGDRNS
jgi:hypothetical protein